MNKGDDDKKGLGQGDTGIKDKKDIDIIKGADQEHIEKNLDDTSKDEMDKIILNIVDQVQKTTNKSTIVDDDDHIQFYIALYISHKDNSKVKIDDN